MNKLILFSIVLMLFSACASKKGNHKNLDLLYNMMQGSYDSSQQAKDDESYYDISLEMHPIWKEKDGKWLFVEQALSSNKDKPYRVRVYEVKTINKDTYISEVYTIRDEERFYGAYKNPILLKNLKPEDITLKEGCGVILTKAENGFKGKTGDDTCKSTLRGASVARSQVSITLKGITSWDQGFNEEGKQVWGAVKGGYIFLKK